MDADDEDQMSMDTNYRDIDDRDRYSASAMDEDGDGDGMSDDISLVGFGEGAGSTVSGPTYSRRDLASSPAVGKSGLAGTPSSSSTPATAEKDRREAKAVDGLASDAPLGYLDAARSGPVTRGSEVEAAERIMRDRLGEGEGRKPALGSPDEAGLGKLYFEEKK